MILTLDFGASKIKSALIDNNKKFLYKYSSNGSLFYSNNKGYVKKDFFILSIKKHLNFYLKKKIKVKKIIICTEMHGFFYLKKNKFSNFISWRSNRKISFDKFFCKSSFNKKTGLLIHPGIPYFKIKKLKNINQVIGISEYICSCLGEYNLTLHSTYAQSLGIYEYAKSELKINEKLKDINKNISIKYGYNNHVGNINFKGHNISVFGGYGDLQCSNHLDDLVKNKIILNISTGSQLIFKFNKSLDYDFRLSFNKKKYNCITHIPSGRYLLYFIKRLKISKKSFFYKINKINISKLKYNELDKYDLKLLYHNFNHIKKNISLENILSMIIYVYANNYKKNLDKLNFNEIIITGGLCKYLFNLIKFLKNTYPHSKINVLENINNDETINFLKNKSELMI
tara:strand:+ start:206 stop:1399 length:1194 start_codon:yes stop_codon:yes gene_type:complete